MATSGTLHTTGTNDPVPANAQAACTGDRMGTTRRALLSTAHNRRAFGAFVLLYAWECLAFFSDALVKGSHLGKTALIERCWGFAGLGIFLGSVAMLLMRRRSHTGRQRERRMPVALTPDGHRDVPDAASGPTEQSSDVRQAAAGGTGVDATASISASAPFTRGTPSFEMLAPFVMGIGCLAVYLLFWFDIAAPWAPYGCALLVGAALPTLHLVRDQSAPSMDRADAIRFYCMAFVTALLVYLVFIPLPTVATVAFCGIAPLAVWALCHRDRECPRDPHSSSASTRSFDLRRAILNTASLNACALWLNFAFFRIVATPWNFEQHAWFYPVVFVSATVALVFMLLLVRRLMQRDNAHDLPRYAVILFAVGYSIVYVSFNDPALETIAFSVCLSCMVALQASGHILWQQFALRDAGERTAPLLVYFAARGLGIAVGMGIGVAACNISGRNIPVTVPIVVVVLLFSCAMALRRTDVRSLLGLDEQRDLGGSGDLQESSKAGDVSTTISKSGAPASMSALDLLVERHGLSPRERDVAGLLLAGRNRPYIMEALSISIGTVNTHVTNIYRKAGVSSRQEFITLAQELERRALDQAY